MWFFVLNSYQLIIYTNLLMLFFLRNSYLRLFWGHLGQIEKILDFRVLILDFLEARE